MRQEKKQMKLQEKENKQLALNKIQSINKQKKAKIRKDSTSDSNTSEEWAASGSDTSEVSEESSVPATRSKVKENDYIVVAFPGK